MMKPRTPLLNLLPLFMLLPAAPVGADEVYSKTEAANRLYKQGDFEKALKLYEDALLLSPADPKLKMNRGSALYRLGDLDNAEKSYEGALSAKEKKERAVAHYNMGNILFRKGETLQKQGDIKAQEQYKAALDHYIRALDLRPSDFDAKWNLQLAYQRIKQMEQQQQNKQDGKDKQKNDNRENRRNEQQQDKQDQKNDRQQQDQKKKDDQENKQQQQNEQDKKERQQQQQPQPAQQQKNDDMKKEEARRLIELYADDADTLNKPPRKGIGKQQQPERDW